MDLRSYLASLPYAERVSYAERAGTTLKTLRNYLADSRNRRLGAEIVIGLERESQGVVKVEKLRPDVDWAYIRGSRRRRAA